MHTQAADALRVRHQSAAGRRSPSRVRAAMSDKRDEQVPFRAVTLFVSLLVGIVLVGVLSYVFPAGDDSMAAELLVDRNTRIFPYPFTIQNVMWIVFCAAAGELVVRHLTGRREGEQIHLGLLPEDDETILRIRDLTPIYHRVIESDPERRYLLQRLLTGALLQFRNSGSVDQINTMTNVSLELYQHEIEQRYNMLRYVVWLVPTLGFIGTVLGIAFAMRSAGVMFAGASITEGSIGPEMMEQLTGDLGVAFYTTLLALMQSAVLMFAMYIIRGKEEGVLNRIGQYCLGNLSNRLVGSEQGQQQVDRQ
ncbi:MAG: MotA/TolQ/ExbB proton channel family protein [Gemmatimonadetes bacterium]|nr:MotA/TolQ/ExbB proton channel family protein [Gemmatimonadota bacterium]MYG35338.1 MotA/TolQ/ExbB proton channel family protein [Gemmatimonadota bacterium]